MESQDDHDVAAHLHEALRALDDELGDGRVVVRWHVERRGHDVAADGALHVGDLLGTLVHEQADEVHLGVVGGNGLAYALEHRRLAGLGRTHDEAALALADGRHEVDGASGNGVAAMLHGEALVGIDGREVAEARARAKHLGRKAVHGGDLLQRRVLVVGTAGAHGALDPIATAQAHVLDELLGDEGVIIPGHVVARADEAVALVREVKHARDVAEALRARRGNVDVLDELGLPTPTYSTPRPAACTRSSATSMDESISRDSLGSTMPCPALLLPWRPRRLLFWYCWLRPCWLRPPRLSRLSR